MSDIKLLRMESRFSSGKNRIPLRFGHETTRTFMLCRAAATVADRNGNSAVGYGETPLAVAWSWPSSLSFSKREELMVEFCKRLENEWNRIEFSGHPMEIGHCFIENVLPRLREDFGDASPGDGTIPYLAALVCNSAFDLALYDACGVLWDANVFECFGPRYMNHDLSWYYGPEFKSRFEGRYPQEYLLPRTQVPTELAAWHLVGGADALTDGDLKGGEPDDGYPSTLQDWIRADGLRCLKIKLKGNDERWDYERIVDVGRIGGRLGVERLAADFNCTVQEPSYVCGILDRLKASHPDIWDMILYIEQPFPYDLEKHPIDVRELSRRKPLIMDESVSDWRHAEMGRALGWTGIALKTCKTLTGAMLMLCWAKEFGMKLTVQDLTNPRLATIPHALLAANVQTMMGVEVNACQFCPEASKDEMRIHPGLYKRRGGTISIKSLGKAGFGYRLEEIQNKGG